MSVAAGLAGAGKREEEVDKDKPDSGGMKGLTKWLNSIAIAGSLTIHSITTTVEAWISDEAVVQAAVKIRVAALDEPTIVAVTGAMAWSDGVSAGAALLFNHIRDVVNASVRGCATAACPNEDAPGWIPVTRITAPTVEIVAATNVDIVAIAVGGALQSEDENQADGSAQNNKTLQMALAGSFSENDIEYDMSTDVTNAIIDASTIATITADDDGLIVAIGGAVAIGDGQASVGAALSFNTISDKIDTHVGAHTKVNSPTIHVDSVTDVDIVAITLGGVKSEDVGIAGSFSKNEISNTILTTVDTKAVLTATGGFIRVSAVDDSNIEADGGAASIIYDDDGNSFGAGIGVAISINDIKNVIRTTVNDAKMFSGRHRGASRIEGPSPRTRSCRQRLG